MNDTSPLVKYGILAAAIALAVAIMLLGDRSPALGENTVKLLPDDTGIVEAGRNVYAEHCASCHGKNLEGQPNWRRPGPDGKMPAPPHDHSGHTWHHADKLLFDLTKFGLKKVAGGDYETDMPAYDGVLTDQQIIAVLSFIKSTWPSDLREYHDHLNAQDAQSKD